MKPLGLFFSLPLLLGFAFASKPHPVPIIYQPLIPTTVQPGSGQFTLTINGTGFVSGAVVTWNGSTRVTSLLSRTTVQAQITAADVSVAGTALVNVVNPKPGGGASNTVFFPIQTPSPTAAFAEVSGFASSGVNAEGEFYTDTFPDLVVADQNSGGFFVNTYQGNGDGTFQSPFPNHSVAPVASMIAADFAGNGVLDLAALDNMGNTTIFANHGKGVFIQRQVFRSPSALVAFPLNAGVAVADFNADGILDLVLTGAELKIMLGNGNGTFGRQLDYPLSCGGIPAVGDFNGDGKLDVATMTPSGELDVLLGNGDGTFQKPASYNASGYSVAAADLNGDGKLDLVTDRMMVLLGNGDGSFRGVGNQHSSVHHNDSSVPSTAPLISDFNGDGKLDVAVEGPMLYLGNGDGTFQPGISIANDGATSVVMGDFNEDGKLDLVGAFLYLQAQLALSPPSLTYANQLVGTKSPPQNVTALNLSATGLPITNIGFGGNDPNDFGQTNNCPATLPAGANCQIAVTFQPTQQGNRDAALNVSYQGVGSPQSVSVSGTGITQTVSLTPKKLTFARRLVGTTSRQQTATLKNTGTGVVTISSISATLPFSQTNNCPATLPVGGSCEIQVTFTPTKKGQASGTLSVVDDAKGSPQTVQLLGSGTIVKVTPVSINFGDQKVGTNSQPVPVIITNVGKAFLHITSIVIRGKDPADFSETNDCGGGLKGGTSCKIQVVFQPQAKGQRSASLQITDDGGGGPQGVQLQGTGT